MSAVVSFPKSGRTWLRVMLDQLAVPCAYSHDHAAHSEAVPFERMQVPGAKFAGQRVVFLSRDPRDTVVSGYFQATRRLGNYQGDLSAFIRDPRHGIEKIARFNLAWSTQAPDGAEVHRVSYEDLRQDSVRRLAQILAFLRVSRPSETIQSAVSDNSFDRMRAREAAGDFAPRYGSALRPGDPSDGESFKVRKGKVGGFGDYLPGEDIDYCNALLRRLGYWETVSACGPAIAGQR